MAYEYTADDVPEIPLPLYTGWGLFADLFGQQYMRGPIRLPSGDVWAPVVTFAGDNRTGIYSPEPFTVGYAIYGFLRFLVSDAGVKFLNTAGFGGTIAADNITTDQIYQLPNQSGTIALEVAYEKTNAEAFSIQAGQPVRLSGASSCVLAISTALANQGVGIADKTTAAAATVTVRTHCLFELADWTNVIGSTSLTVDAEYFLGAVAGSLTENPVDATGNVLQYFGRAVSAQILHLNVQRPLLL